MSINNFTEENKDKVIHDLMTLAKSDEFALIELINTLWEYGKEEGAESPYYGLAACYIENLHKQEIYVFDWMLARIYSNGLGNIFPNRTYALELLENYVQEFPDDGDVMMELADAYMMGTGTRVDTDTAIEWCKKSFDAGFMYAGIALGKILSVGLNGAPKNIPEAKKYLRKVLKSKTSVKSEKDSAKVLLKRIDEDAE